ncbi:MAG: nitroreductase family protein [Anaerolineaceae bacterium]|jgi:nitroreductase
MMIESIRHRRSIRKYLPTPVEEEKLQAVLEAARLAPSGNNKQPWAFIVVKEEAGRVALAEATRKQMWIAEAPIVIVAVADVEARGVDVEGLVLDEHSPLWELKRVIRDTAIAIGYLLLEADNQGLGTCWCGAFEQDDIRPLLGIPEDKFVLAVIPLGYADQEPPARPRRALEEIVHYERW